MAESRVRRVSAETALRNLLRRPVAYHRAFAQIGGGATAGLMLSQAWYWTPKAADGWFYKSLEEWEEETGLTRTEQETARKRLAERGLLETKRAGMPARLYFRVNVERVLSLIAENPQSSLQETRKQEGAKPAALIAENPQTTIKDSETTPETTGKEPRYRVAAHSAAVRLCRELTGRSPNAAQRAEIAAQVRDLDRWRAVLTEYALEGRPPNRVDWMLERYHGRGAARDGPPGAFVLTPELVAEMEGISVEEARGRLAYDTGTASRAA